MIRLLSTITCALIMCASLAAQTLVPAPQEVSSDGDNLLSFNTLNLNHGIKLEDSAVEFSEHLNFLKHSPLGSKVNVECGKEISELYGIPSVSGAYTIDIQSRYLLISRTVNIRAYDEAGVFYAVQTLKKLYEQTAGRVPCCHISDCPDTPRRGIVEAFNGPSWSRAYRLSIIDLCGQLKMNAYLYAPQDDPYVAGADWRVPYPRGKSEIIVEMLEACGKKHMEFIWALRLDDDFEWSEYDYTLMLEKFERMYRLGVRSFAVYFDNVQDVSEEKKKECLDRMDRDFVCRYPDVRPILTDFDGLYVTDDDGESLKISLYGVAGYAWNKDGYDPEECLNVALKDRAADIADAYRLFALHSDIFPSAFRREESDGVRTFNLAGYSTEAYDDLMEEFIKLEKLPHEMTATGNTALYYDIRPWVEEMGKLGTRGRRVLECLVHYQNGDKAAFWTGYAENLMTEVQRDMYARYPVGNARLQPFIDTMMSELFVAFTQKYNDKADFTRLDIDGMDVFIAMDPVAGCHFIMDDPGSKDVIVRLADASDRYVAEFCIDSPYFDFELKENAVRAEILVGRKVRETVYVK